ncbi:MAG: hypothetical protein J5673_05060 [Candidatus Methanomethylophilaceae archaeon]|nr:hypothetical protein [Candidatus Methanomethylophilaceae archaeon]
MENALPARIISTSERDLLPEHFIDVGKAVGQEYRHVLVGSDSRPSTNVIKHAFISGVLSTGAKLYDAGCLPMPALPFADCDVNCMVYIGNPDNNDNMSGMDLMNRNGTYFSDVQMLRLDEYMKGTVKIPENDDQPSLEKVTGTLDTYRTKLRSASGNRHSDANLRFFTDSMTHNTPVVLNGRNTLALMVNCHMDNRSTERIVPNNEEDLKMLAKTVKANYGSVGIAINANGDRIAGIDENGGYIGGTLMFALLMDRLKPASVALPIDTPMVITDLFDSKFTFTPSSYQRIGDAVKAENLKFGGSADGAFIFPSMSYAPDAIMAGNIISTIASEMSISNFIDDIPEYSVTRTSMRYMGDTNIVNRRMDTTLRSIGCDNVYRADSWRLDYGEGIIIITVNESRMTIDITVESKDKVYSTGLMEIATEAVDSCLKGISR